MCEHVATKKELSATLGSATSAVEKALFQLREAQRRAMKPGLPDIEYQLHEATLALSRARLVLYRRAQNRVRRTTRKR